MIYTQVPEKSWHGPRGQQGHHHIDLVGSDGPWSIAGIGNNGQFWSVSCTCCKSRVKSLNTGKCLCGKANGVPTSKRLISRNGCYRGSVTRQQKQMPEWEQVGFLSGWLWYQRSFRGGEGNGGGGRVEMEPKRWLHLLHPEVSPLKPVSGARAVALEEAVIDILPARVWLTTNWKQNPSPAGPI